MTMTIDLPDTVQYYIEQKIIDEKKAAVIINNYLESLTEVKNKKIVNNINKFFNKKSSSKLFYV